jgi:hypothetical protein
MDTVNRSAIAVKPKQRFLDWLHAIDPTSVEITLLEVCQDPTIYLIPECGTKEELEDVLRERCEVIFEEQLDSWWREASAWPQERSYDVFCQWFAYEHSSLLIDLGDQPLIRE